MNKKLVFGLSAACVASAFWACGSGDVVNSDDNLEGLAMALMSELDGTAVAEAVKNCEADANCSNEMSTAPQISVESSSDEAPATSSAATSSSATPVASSSSKAVVSSSSIGPIGVSSSSVAASSSSTEIGVSSSTPVAAGTYGTCAPATATAEMGVATTWKFNWDTKNSGVGVTDILAATYEWTFDDGTSQTGKTPAVTYTTSGQKTASVTVTAAGASQKIDCTPLNVNGAKITGCTCNSVNISPDVASGESASWSVSDCASTANIISYTWTGATASADGLSATAAVAAKGDAVTGVSVAVANDDNTVVTVTCADAKAIDSSSPDYVLEAQNTSIELPAGEVTLVLNLPESWHNGTTGTCSFSCNFDGAGTIDFDGETTSGSYYVAASIPIASTINNHAASVTLSAAASCSLGW